MAAPPIYNPVIPCVHQIPGGMFPGRMIRVQGSLPPGAQRFAINLQCGPNTDPRDDIALHLNFRFPEMCVVRNHLSAMNWGVEETNGGMPLNRGEQFEALILCEPHALKVALNGCHFCEFLHRTPFQRISHLTVDGDVAIQLISFEGAQPPPQQMYMAEPPAYGAYGQQGHPPPAYGAPGGYGQGQAQPRVQPPGYGGPPQGYGPPQQPQYAQQPQMAQGPMMQGQQMQGQQMQQGRRGMGAGGALGMGAAGLAAGGLAGYAMGGGFNRDSPTGHEGGYPPQDGSAPPTQVEPPPASVEEAHYQDQEPYEEEPPPPPPPPEPEPDPTYYDYDDYEGDYYDVD